MPRGQTLGCALSPIERRSFSPPLIRGLAADTEHWTNGETGSLANMDHNGGVLAAKAHPSKAFFIDMLTRDISLSDCILDLVDNSLHRLITQSGLDVSEHLFAGTKARKGGRAPSCLLPAPSTESFSLVRPRGST